MKPAKLLVRNLVLFTAVLFAGCSGQGERPPVPQPKPGGQETPQVVLQEETPGDKSSVKAAFNHTLSINDAQYMAGVYVQHRKYDSALEACHYVLSQLPVGKIALETKLNMGQIYEEKWLPEAAIPIYEEIIEECRASYETADKEYKEYMEERKSYGEALKKYNEDMKAFLHAGTGERPQRPFLQSRPPVAHPQVLETYATTAAFSLANIHIRQRKPELAIKAYVKVLDNRFSKAVTWQALFALGDLHEKLGNYEEAITTYENILALGFKRGTIYSPLVVSQNPMRIAQPDMPYDPDYPSNPGPPVIVSRPSVVLMLIANIYENTGKMDKAVETYERIINSSDSQPREIEPALFFIGNIRESQGKITEALGYYEKVSEMGPALVNNAGGRRARGRSRLAAMAAKKLERLKQQLGEQKSKDEQ